MTLTRAQLLDKGKPRCEEVEIEGIGTVWLQSVGEVKQSRRDAQSIGTNGKVKPDWKYNLRTFAIIDHVCTAPGEPMFTDEDIETVGQLDKALTRPLWEAIQAFNGEEDATKKNTGESDDLETS